MKVFKSILFACITFPTFLAGQTDTCENRRPKTCCFQFDTSFSGNTRFTPIDSNGVSGIQAGVIYSWTINGVQDTGAPVTVSNKWMDPDSNPSGVLNIKMCAVTSGTNCSCCCEKQLAHILGVTINQHKREFTCRPGYGFTTIYIDRLDDKRIHFRYSYAIYNSAGQKMLQASDVESMTAIDIWSLPEGNYYIRIQHLGGQETLLFQKP